jgi:hypothetical protein
MVRKRWRLLGAVVALGVITATLGFLNRQPDEYQFLRRYQPHEWFEEGVLNFGHGNSVFMTDGSSHVWRRFDYTCDMRLVKALIMVPLRSEGPSFDDSLHFTLPSGSEGVIQPLQPFMTNNGTTCVVYFDETDRESRLERMWATIKQHLGLGSG